MVVVIVVVIVVIVVVARVVFLRVFCVCVCSLEFVVSRSGWSLELLYSLGLPAFG